MIESAPMADLCNRRNARVPWLIGVLLALSLAVIVPIHLNHRFFPACGDVHAGLRVSHHTVVDRIGGRLEAQIDRTSRTPAPESATVALAFAMEAPAARPRTTSASPQSGMFRRLQIVPARADDGDPFSHTASLRV
jgi:hypothetical protein